MVELRVVAWRWRWLTGALVAGSLALVPSARAEVSPTSTVDGLTGTKGDRTITPIGVLADQRDLAKLRVGTAGSWFPLFGADTPTIGAPTGDRAVDELPPWIAALNHTTGPSDPGCTESGALERGCLPTYLFRTFSQDGPARAAGPFGRLRLPSGACGSSGAIVDPHTFVDGEPNTNNTVNRLQLQADVPSSFHVGVLVDNTGGANHPGSVELRGAVGTLDVPEDVADNQIEATSKLAMLAPNGVPDLYVFHVEHFVSGDYLKLRLKGATSAASFGGLLFDETYAPHLRKRTHECR